MCDGLDQMYDLYVKVLASVVNLSVCGFMTTRTLKRIDVDQ